MASLNKKVKKTEGDELDKGKTVDTKITKSDNDENSDLDLNFGSQVKSVCHINTQRHSKLLF